MKTVFAFILISLASLSANALSCNSEGMDERTKAECLFAKTIAERSNSEINAQIGELTQAGYVPFNQIVGHHESALGAGCSNGYAEDPCTILFRVYLDYQKPANGKFSSVEALIEVPKNGAPVLTSVRSLILE